VSTATEPTARERAAGHEAAHAVVAYLIGKRPRMVDLGDGTYPPSADDAYARGDLGPPPSKLGTVADEVLILLAGGYGERMLGPSPDVEQHTLRDRRTIATLLRAVCFGPADRDALLRALELRVEAIVGTPKFIALHEHLTAVLVRRGHMGADDLKVELTLASRHHAEAAGKLRTDAHRVVDDPAPVLP
jgi:hypothetical protein